MKEQNLILVVDDDREFASMLREFLEREGHAVIVAGSGQEALRALRQTPISVVLLDLLLPDIGGVELMSEAQRLDSRPEVVIITGNATLDSAIKAVKAGAGGYIVKPVDLTRLGELIDSLLERRLLIRENARLSSEARERLKETETLLAISSTISSTLDLQEALRSACRELAHLIGADTASVYLHKGGTDSLVPFAAYGIPKEHLRTHATTPLPSKEQGFYLPLWKERRPIHSDDVPHDPRFSHEFFRRFQHQSGLLLPLILDGEVAGVFYLVWWKVPRQFTEAELTLMESVCRQVSLFLRNARLYEQRERDRRRLEMLNEVSRRLAQVHDTDGILTLIVNEATRLLGAEAAGLRLLQGDDLVVRARTQSAMVLMSRERLKVGESLSGLVVATGEPVVAEDLVDDTRYAPEHKRAALEHGFHAFLGVPLRAHGRTIGALNIYTKSRRRFMPDDISLASAFADQASLAIDKGRLLREAEGGRQVLERIYRVGISMRTSWEQADRLQAFIQGAHEAVGFERVYVLLVTPDGSSFELVRTIGEEGIAPSSLPLSPAAGAFYQAFQTRRPVAVLRDEDLGEILSLDPAYREHPYFRSKRFVVAPLVAGERVLGVASADNKQSRKPIPPASVELFSLLCQQLATAWDEARLYSEVETQRTRLAQIFDSTSDGIVLVSRDGLIAAANLRAGELLTLDLAEAVGRDFAGVLSGLDDATASRDSLVTSLRSLLEDPDRGGQGDLELAAVRRVLRWVARPSKDASGTTVGLTITFQDVTEEREISKMKSDFVSFVTHQLRTPLAGIRWFVELAAQGTDISQETRSYIEDARESAERLITLVNDLLDISRLESGKLTIVPQETQLGEVTRSVLDELGLVLREKGHRLSVTGAEEIPRMLVDPQLLRQVILNLVSNAIKYTLPGGEIAIRMSQEDRLVRWAIQDSGIGIPPEAQRRLFEKFYRAEDALTLETDGTGLGLYLVRLIVERFEGRVWCESEKGKGATFTFTLPR
ncbi:MAG: GAF domain-containing protein [Candidatus Methylomirabilia bacterium]